MMTSTCSLRMVPRTALKWPWEIDRSMARARSQGTGLCPLRATHRVSRALGGRHVRLARARLQILSS